MNKKTKEMLKYLKLNYLLEYWDDEVKKAEKIDLSYDKFLVQIIKNEFNTRAETAIINRINRAKIPNDYSMETYPFEKQPHLKQEKTSSEI